MTHAILTNHVVTHRPGEADKVGGTMVGLLPPDAWSFVSGATLTADSGTLIRLYRAMNLSYVNQKLYHQIDSPF